MAVPDLSTLVSDQPKALVHMGRSGSPIDHSPLRPSSTQTPMLTLVFKPKRIGRLAHWNPSSWSKVSSLAVIRAAPQFDPPLFPPAHQPPKPRWSDFPCIRVIGTFIAGTVIRILIYLRSHWERSVSLPAPHANWSRVACTELQPAFIAKSQTLSHSRTRA